MSIELRSLRSLEWERLTTYLAEQNETAEGKRRSLQLQPELGQAFDLDAEIARAQILLDQTEEASALIASRTAFSLSKLGDVRESIALLRAGAVISANELARVKALLVVARSVRGSLVLLAPAQFPHLHLFVSTLVALPKLIDAIDFAIDDYGAVKDTASSLLRSLRRERHKLDQHIKDELSRIIQSQSGTKALQEPIYTMRGGRFVLPVMANMRYLLDGIVHDASGSGLTVYVEPISVVELSNQTKIKDSAIESEIERIVVELCDQIRPFADQIGECYSALIDLDCIMARGRLSQLYAGIKPVLSNEPMIELRGARHPLLVLQNRSAKNKQEPKNIVENTVIMQGSERTLVITGPNTGGKTVLLKLIGIYSLMLRCGLLVPAKSGSSTALFPVVCADIGDEQSIEQSLSTFSAHMKNVVEIVDTAKRGMLVLLDEIGAGTDPKEGAALARAILEHLLSRDVVTIATTHLGELKMLAYTNSGFVNGSFEFDEATLSPTYKLRLGVPGSSKANTIAQRLGLDSEVVARARELTVASEHELEQIIENLNARLAQVYERQEQLSQLQDTLENKEAKLNVREEKLLIEQDKVRGRMASELEDELKAAREIMKEMIAGLQREPSIKAAQKTAAELEALRATVSFLQERQKVIPKGPDPNVLTLGMTVRLKSLNSSGTVQEIIYSDKQQLKIDQVMVQVGTLKVKVSPSDLEIRGTAKVKTGHQSVVRGGRPPSAKSQGGAAGSRLKVGSAVQYNDPAVFVRSERNTIDLRGKRADDASSLVEQFVDSCAVSGISPLMIIHGHGTGAIKTIVREFLSRCRYANRQRPGETYEGGDGVTIVELGE
ncbi:endonuclease MutS2 [soil metagenome]